MAEPRNTSNPKQAMGDRKVNLALMPAAAVIRMCEALQYGAFKAPRADGKGPGYGPFNWRVTKVEAMTYIAAAMRHILDWVDGEERADDSGVHHIGHAMASLAILLDAQDTDGLIDNRPNPGAAPALIGKPPITPGKMLRDATIQPKIKVEWAQPEDHQKERSGFDVVTDPVKDRSGEKLTVLDMPEFEPCSDCHSHVCMVAGTCSHSWQKHRG